ncbi:unnamed protein product [Linum tenue]|uniref:Protein SirB1 N-terminal domain-containing protein n=1 Tax=Linum tenue TaxID=586396 RepID=A0AAV0RUH4_9ROSI|nr:unnamed protein product [Linum tenue]
MVYPSRKNLPYDYLLSSQSFFSRSVSSGQTSTQQAMVGTMAATLSSPFTPLTSLLGPSSSKSTKLHLQPSCSRFSYRTADLKLLLHDALDSLGIDTSHAREARQGFLSQIEKFSDMERETSISINRRVDLGKTALYIAAEDDSLISHSSVPLPVDAFIERLDDLSMGYCSTYTSSLCSSPQNFLHSLDNYLYVDKVLTRRSGSALMLSLIYSEILKMLRLWGLVDFDCEIYYPYDSKDLPRGYDKKKSKESDRVHILTSQTLLEEVLRSLKEAFWPFQYDDTRSLFLSAANAANCVATPNAIEDSGFQLASAKAAQHRLDRGVWTSVTFGDMRRAMSGTSLETIFLSIWTRRFLIREFMWFAACERLVLLGSDPKDLRDYSILLYHCGFYDHSLQYLTLFEEIKGSVQQNQSSTGMSRLEDDATEKLMMRLNLIFMEEGWSEPSRVRKFLGNNSEPW